MKVILFGATGMVGQGVLRECLLDSDVQGVLSILRGLTGQNDPKVRELVHKDFLDFSPIADQLSGYDACFFCLGISSAGMKEEDYLRITYGFTLAAARLLATLNPNMTFIYVSGMGTDNTEKGPRMWARVKGKTENDLLQLPFKGAYIFRPGAIVPLHGIKSRTKLYRISYVVLGPLLPLLQALFPKSITTTEQIGKAMLKIAKQGYTKSVLEPPDIDQI